MLADLDVVTSRKLYRNTGGTFEEVTNFADSLTYSDERCDNYEASPTDNACVASMEVTCIRYTDAASRQPWGAVAWADFDGDSRLDLAVFACRSTIFLRNDGSGNFVTTSVIATTSAIGWPTHPKWFDYDGTLKNAP